MDFLRRLFSKKRAEHVASPDRVSATEVRKKLTSSGVDALLVCAYEDQDRCEQLRLEGALTLNELESKVSSLSKHRELIFYCA